MRIPRAYVVVSNETSEILSGFLGAPSGRLETCVAKSGNSGLV